jgi:hypothetical protein
MPQPTSDRTGAFTPRSWTRLDHQLQEVSPGTFQVRDRGGRQLGWITTLGPRFRAHGDAQTLEQSAVLGTFLSGTAALRLVIGNYDMTVLRATVLREVRELEREFEARRHPSAADRRPSNRTGVPHENRATRPPERMQPPRRP